MKNKFEWTKIWSTEIGEALIDGTISAHSAKVEALKDLNRDYITEGLFSRVELELNAAM